MSLARLQQTPPPRMPLFFDPKTLSGILMWGEAICEKSRVPGFFYLEEKFSGTARPIKTLSGILGGGGSLL